MNVMIHDIMTQHAPRVRTAHKSLLERTTDLDTDLAKIPKWVEDGAQICPNIGRRTHIFSRIGRNMNMYSLYYT